MYLVGGESHVDNGDLENSRRDGAQERGERLL